MNKDKRICWYFSLRNLSVANYAIDESYTLIGCFGFSIANAYCNEHNLKLIQEY